MITLKRLRVENFKLLRRLQLLFPRRCTVLIEGLNESGKSTLFESVFFALYGIPLATEGRGKGNLESVIHHRAQSALVELVLEVDETELEIQRILRRGRPSEASLVVRRPSAPDERVAGVLAVNARVVQELGGLDSEAMLNSCFVEQKKLSKLEDLAPGQRKESVRRLLNLERLALLAERFKVTLQDERSLAEARDRLELAEAAARLPLLGRQRAEMERIMGAASFSVDGLSALPDAAEVASRLLQLRKERDGARWRGIMLSVTSVAALLLALGLLLLGVQAAVWLLPAGGLAALYAGAAFRAGARLGRQVRELEAELAATRDQLLAKIGELEGLRRRLEERLGIDGSTLDPEQCRQELWRLARQMEVRRRAAAIVEQTMERIVRLVLPSTERNLSQILPWLTAGRYHEARVAEDYQIEVWDELAGRYVSKSLFSGGARDQFSLALRLAFAIATLPQELGTAPGFIFLDEPLSSFDGPRTEALIRLLTRGQVAADFSQIFVISHNRSFDASAFQYRLVMRDGHVVESNLGDGVV